MQSFEFISKLRDKTGCSVVDAKLLYDHNLTLEEAENILNMNRTMLKEVVKAYCHGKTLNMNIGG